MTASVLRAVRANQTTGYRHARICALAGQRKARDAARNIEGQIRQVNAIYSWRDTHNARERAVVSELEFVYYVRPQYGLEGDHTVLRNLPDDNASASHTVRLAVVSLVAEEAKIHRVILVECVVDSKGRRTLVHCIIGLKLDRIEKIRTSAECDCACRAESRDQRSGRRVANYRTSAKWRRANARC